MSVPLYRRLLCKILGREKLKILARDLLNSGGLSPLKLFHEDNGILKYQSYEVSGESYLIEHILKQYLKPSLKNENVVLLDVGANIGTYSKLLRSTFATAEIHAFEPNPKTYEQLANNMISLEIECHCCGLSSEAGSLKLYNCTEASKGSHSSLYKAVLTDIHHAKQVVETKFNSITLDDFCTSKGIDHIDFIKIDVEGHELEVLKGCKSLLRQQKIDIIQFEFTQLNVISRVFLRDFYEILKGFNIYRLNTDKLIFLGDYQPVNEIFQYQNFVAIHKDKDLGFL